MDNESHVTLSGLTLHCVLSICIEYCHSLDRSMTEAMYHHRQPAPFHL